METPHPHAGEQAGSGLVVSDSPADRRTVEAIETWLVERLSRRLYRAPDEIDVRESFFEFGLSSREAVLLTGEMEEWLRRRISPMVIYEYPTIESLAQHLSQLEEASDEGATDMDARGLAPAGSNGEEMRREGLVDSDLPASSRKLPVVMLFPDHGPQWLGVGQELLPEVRSFWEVLKQCDDLLGAHVDWSLLDTIAFDQEGSYLDAPRSARPVVFALQVALATLWRSQGVTPHAVIGQGTGVLAAAHVAGQLSLDEALRNAAGLEPLCDWPAAAVFSSAIQEPTARRESAVSLQDQLREPASLTAVVEPWIDDGCSTFLEIGPEATFAPTVTSCLAATGRQGRILPTLRVGQEEWTSILETLDALNAIREELPADSPEHSLSYGQQALWFLDQLAPGSSAYNLVYTTRLPADTNVAWLQCGLRTIVERHAILRTTYDLREGRPVQRVHAESPVELDVVDASAWSSEELDRRLEEEADRPFDLKRGPVIRAKLFRRTDAGDVLSLCVHHIAMDAWSFAVVLQELRTVYLAEQQGTTPELPPLNWQYTDYVRSQAKMLAGPEGERLASYWREQLTDCQATLDLPTDRLRPPVQSYRGALWRFELGDDLSERLRALAKAERATPHMMLLAAFQVLLYRYTGQEDFLVGSPTVGRDRAELEGIVGYFVNPVVVRARLSGSQAFRNHLEQVRERVLGALAHQAYPFPLLVEQLQVHRDPSRSPLFQVAFDWYTPTRAIEQELSLMGSIASQEEDGGEATPIIAQRGAAFDLMLMMGVAGRSFSGTLQYNTDLFEPATVTRMAGHFCRLLEGIVADPECPLDELPLLSEEEQRQVLLAWNATQQEYPSARVDELVAAEAERTPDAVAVQCDGRQLTYRELDARANQVARRLQTMGVKPGRLVGLCVDRSVDMLVAVLGTWKAGGAYVPLDPSYPKERLAFMIEDSHLAVLVTQSHLIEMLPVGDTPLLRLDADATSIATECDQPPACGATAEDLAYVIYTSGSTGKPKGVEVLHRGVVNFLCAMARCPGLTAEDSLLAVTTLSFDISVLELMLPLIVGARVMIVSRRVAADGVQLRAALEQSGATFMQATPATWRMLLEAGWAGSPGLTALCGGEAMPCDLANALLERVRCVWNVYGPTETTIWSTLQQVEAGRMPVPIGRPIANTQVYVLDHQGRPVPIGVAGELYIGGDGVARGYLNRPDLTTERFVADPFRGHPDARMYRTGDLVRYLADGTLEFLGRLDLQVKVSGYRIELGEIEAALDSHPAVGQAVVVAQDSPRAQGTRRLVAYYVPRQEPTPTVTELREFLKRSLPDYMVPSAFVCLASLPLTPNGKVDRRRLPSVDTARPELAAAYVAPRTEKERRLAELCAKVLGLEKVGVHDNFFELGAASIQSVEISARATDAGLPLTPEMLFQHQTIAELAAAIESKAEPTLPRACGKAARATAATSTSPAESPAPVTLCGNTLIESLGVYLPPRAVSTDEVVRGCRNPLAFPLEQMTGIRSRRVAGGGEYAIDLARKAIEECLAHSKYQADDIELLICSSISRMDGAGSFTFEPSTAVRLRKHFGFRHALAFDISNACVGMFTAIHIADAFLKLGLVRVALVASGEYITHLTDVAQKEIEGFMDPRLACLTVGDAGAAITLETAPDDQVGFQALDLYTLGRHSSLCIAQATDQTHGGAIMHSDPIRQTAVALKQSVAHAAHVLGRSGWSPRDLEHLIMHQTSQTALKDAMREINATFQDSVCHAGNTIFNLAERGNTATTSHAVALWDSIQSGRIRSGDRILFGISGSGQTTGTALYTLDTLPDRLRDGKGNGKPHRAARDLRATARRDLPRVRVESLGTCPPGAAGIGDMIAMARLAASRCLETSAYDRSDIDLLVYAGVYRNHFLSEPAVAALVAGDLGINDTIESQTDKKTFALDLTNGGLGFLNACQVAMRLLQAGRHRTAMVIAAEVENNAEVMPQSLRGVRETASAVILDVASDGRSGFGQFVFKHAPEHLDALTASSGHEAGKHVLRVVQDARLHDYYLELIPAAVEELLKSEGLELDRIRAILPSQISAEFIAKLGERLGGDPLRMVEAVGQGPDLFTSSLPYALDRLRERHQVAPGDIGLIIHVGSGIQVGCATYYF